MVAKHTGHLIQDTPGTGLMTLWDTLVELDNLPEMSGLHEAAPFSSCSENRDHNYRTEDCWLSGCSLCSDGNDQRC